MTRPAAHVTTSPAAPAKKKRTHFRCEVEWVRKDDQLGSEMLEVADKIGRAFAPNDGVKILDESFLATWTIHHARLKQMFQCLGVLRPFRLRYTPFDPDDKEVTMDDVHEALYDTRDWSFYPSIPDPDPRHR